MADGIRELNDSGKKTMNTYPQGSFQIIDHTADAGIRVTAVSLEGLFEVAALALSELITRVELITYRVERTFQLAENDLETLLVSWLQELLYLFDTEGLIFGRFQVKLEDGRLEAIAWGEPFDPGVHPLKTEVKAVTYHQLELVRTASGWQTQLIFDV
jgi:SHS2 domain-containing protein